MNDSIHLHRADFFKTLGHPLRLAILDSLYNGPLSVSELQISIGAEQSLLSQHLAKLKLMRFVTSERKKTTIYYRVYDLEIYQFLDLARGIFTRQLQHSQELLSEMETNKADLNK